MTSVFETPHRRLDGETAPDRAEQWRGPNGYTLLSWEVDFRSGGAARLCLRSPEGGDQWVEGVHLEIVEPERVVFTGNFGLGGGAVTFRRA